MTADNQRYTACVHRGAWSMSTKTTFGTPCAQCDARALNALKFTEKSALETAENLRRLQAFVASSSKSEREGIAVIECWSKLLVELFGEMRASGSAHEHAEAIAAQVRERFGALTARNMVLQSALDGVNALLTKTGCDCDQGEKCLVCLLENITAPALSRTHCSSCDGTGLLTLDPEGGALPEDEHGPCDDCFGEGSVLR